MISLLRSAEDAEKTQECTDPNMSRGCLLCDCAALLWTKEHWWLPFKLNVPFFHQRTCCQRASVVIGADGRHQGRSRQPWYAASAADVIATLITRCILWPEPNRCRNDPFLCLSDVKRLLVNTWETFRGSGGNRAKFQCIFMRRKRATSLLTGASHAASERRKGCFWSKIGHPMTPSCRANSSLAFVHLLLLFRWNPDTEGRQKMASNFTHSRRIKSNKHLATSLRLILCCVIKSPVRPPPSDIAPSSAISSYKYTPV